MSRRRMGARAAARRKATVSLASAETVQARAAALTSALEAGRECLSAGGVDRAQVAIKNAAARTSFAGGHTVVALAGATGSGKSSLFNALIGADVAPIGFRRPTSSTPIAAIWGTESASALLDWLKVGARHQVDGRPSGVDERPSGVKDCGVGAAGSGVGPVSSGVGPVSSGVGPAGQTRSLPVLKPAPGPESDGLEPERPESDGLESDGLELDGLELDGLELDGLELEGLELDGLVLLDLPDFDSLEATHRVEADRLLDLVDVFIWVTDPQKYADARLHEDYIARLSAHDAVTVAVLNQADRLTPEALAACRSDLLRLLGADGVDAAEVIATSALDGSGVIDLHHRISMAVAGQNAAVRRLDSDLRAAATVLRSGVADSEPRLGESDSAGLVDALSRAAGIPVIVDAVERDYRREAWARTGWPFTRWVRALRPAPLKLLRLNQGAAAHAGGISESDVRSVLGRSSLPPATPAARSAVELATRELGDRVGQGLPQPWTDAVTNAATPPGEDLGDALDQAVVSTPLRGRNPSWWAVFGALQWALAIAAVTGFVWLAVLMVLGWLQLPAVDTPRLGPLPYPFLMLAGGLLAGFLLAGVTRAIGRIGGRRTKSLAASRLRESVAQVARDRLVAPVQRVLDRHRLTREHLDSARKRA